MSRQNKVNPGQYTQRGRLAQDDMARELKVQDASISSQKSWRHSDHQTPWPDATSGDAEAEDSPASQTSEAREKPRQPAARAKASAGTRASAKAKPGSKAKVGAKAKAPRLVRRSAKREGGVARKAVLARGAGKGSALLKAGQKKKKAATTAKRRR
jgi:hypothetical protein